MRPPTPVRPVRRLLAVAALAVVALVPVTGNPFGDRAPLGDLDAHHAGHGGAGSAYRDVVPVGDTAEARADGDRKDGDESDRDAKDGDRGDGDAEQDGDAKDGDGKQDGDGQKDGDGKDEDGNDGDAEKDGDEKDAGATEDDNGLDVLGRDCSKSDLAPHDGFQKSPACVSTAMGEVAAEDKLPSLLITAAPEKVAVGESFELKVSTRNLVRDRFLGAAQGGYYLESSFLDANGLQRGHFHTACRLLPGTDEAPDSGRTPEFFLATQDNKGGAEPDTVTIAVPGIKEAGELQCTSWAGDGSHRTPMMTKANETPAIDSVRIAVTG